MSTGKAFSYDQFSDRILKDQEKLDKLASTLADLWSENLNQITDLERIKRMLTTLASSFKTIFFFFFVICLLNFQGCQFWDKQNVLQFGLPVQAVFAKSALLSILALIFRHNLQSFTLFSFTLYNKL